MEVLGLTRFDLQLADATGKVEALFVIPWLHADNMLLLIATASCLCSVQKLSGKKQRVAFHSRNASIPAIYRVIAT